MDNRRLTVQDGDKYATLLIVPGMNAMICETHSDRWMMELPEQLPSESELMRELLRLLES